MGQELDAEIKTRVPADIKLALEDLAKERHLKLSDIVREALRDYTDGAKQPELALGKEEGK